MWYAVCLLIESSRSPAGAEPIWEESIRLIEAATEEEARTKAERLGQAEDQSYLTTEGTLTWTFNRVERIYAIDADTLIDGTELFSRFLRASDVARLFTED